jgi:hypothetical protein
MEFGRTLSASKEWFETRSLGMGDDRTFRRILGDGVVETVIIGIPDETLGGRGRLGSDMLGSCVRSQQG